MAEVAHRWGFTHLGRFGTAYRRKYGRPPSETLRRAQPTAPRPQGDRGTDRSGQRAAAAAAGSPPMISSTASTGPPVGSLPRSGTCRMNQARTKPTAATTVAQRKTDPMPSVTACWKIRSAAAGMARRAAGVSSLAAPRPLAPAGLFATSESVSWLA